MIQRMGMALILVSITLWVLAAVGLIPYKIALICSSIALVANIKRSKALQQYTFTGWVLVCILAALLYPDSFVRIGDFRLELLIIPLTQLIMFGMGATLSLDDFVRVAKSPLPILIGTLLQYTAMPLVALLIVTVFGFEGELAAGAILIGSVSGGMASNLMTYLAKGNVALSVTMTFVSTLISPMATPLVMSLLAGTFIVIDPVQMMFSIINMIIVPLVAGLIAHDIVYKDRAYAQGMKKLIGVLALFAILMAGIIFIGRDVLGTFYSGVLLGTVMVIAVIIIKMILINRSSAKAIISRIFPLISMICICIVITILISQTHSMILDIGMLLLLAVILHNFLGYGMGYWVSKGVGILLGRIGFKLNIFESAASRVSESECRTVAIEVGMQNAGMATGLAIDVFKSYVAALPANLFGTWMNVSGSILANYWQKRPLPEDNQPLSPDEK